jgi:hypothetical protein
MTVNFDSIACEFELSTGVWTDVYDDVIGGIRRVKSGIRGYGPLDRVASTGECVFTLENINNVYTPQHTNCISGFEKGVKFRIVLTYNGLSATKFYGKVEKITPYDGEGLINYVDVTVLDYMNVLATHELQQIERATDKSIDELVPLIIANIPNAPEDTDYNSGQDTFSYGFDTTRDKTIAMHEIGKLALSELGFVYVKHSASSDEMLVVDGRYTRTSGAVKEVPILEDVNLELEDGTELLLEDGTELLLDTITEDVEFDDEANNVNAEYGNHYYNEVKVTTYPREIDSAATSILFDLDRYIQISAGETKTLTGRYRDPNQEAQSVTGFDMVTPVSTTDYVMNTASDGSGSDITADLDVTADYGASGVEYELTNNNASTGYITKLQARGKGVYIYRPIEYSAEYTTGINADGRSTLNLPMKYQDNPTAGESFGDVLVDLYSQKRLVIHGLSYCANSSTSLMSSFIFCSVGDRIHVKDSGYDIEGDYVIQAQDFEITENGIAYCYYELLPESLLPASDFWKLGETGYSELGETTKLGF